MDMNLENVNFLQMQSLLRPMVGEMVIVGMMTVIDNGHVSLQ